MRYSSVRVTHEKRCEVAKRVYPWCHNGKPMPEYLIKMMDRLFSITEDMWGLHGGDINDSFTKRYCLNMANMSFPMLIATDLVRFYVSGNAAVLHYVEIDENDARLRETYLSSRSCRLDDIPYSPSAEQLYNRAADKTPEELQNLVCDIVTGKLDSVTVQGLSTHAQFDETHVFNAEQESPDQRHHSVEEIIKEACNRFYEQQHRFHPSYILISPTLEKAFSELPGFGGVKQKAHLDFYLYGTYSALTVYVAPNLEDDYFLLGFCDEDGLFFPGACLSNALFVCRSDDWDGDILKTGNTYTDMRFEMLNPSLVYKGKINNLSGV